MQKKEDEGKVRKEIKIVKKIRMKSFLL